MDVKTALVILHDTYLIEVSKKFNCKECSGWATLSVDANGLAEDRIVSLNNIMHNILSESGGCAACPYKPSTTEHLKHLHQGLVEYYTSKPIRWNKLS